jgi:hypothetical protein
MAAHRRHNKWFSTKPAHFGNNRSYNSHNFRNPAAPSRDRHPHIGPNNVAGMLAKGITNGCFNILEARCVEALANTINPWQADSAWWNV